MEKRKTINVACTRTPQNGCPCREDNSREMSIQLAIDLSVNSRNNDIDLPDRRNTGLCTEGVSRDQIHWSDFVKTEYSEEIDTEHESEIASHVEGNDKNDPTQQSTSLVHNSDTQRVSESVTCEGDDYWSIMVPGVSNCGEFSETRYDKSESQAETLQPTQPADPTAEQELGTNGNRGFRAESVIDLVIHSDLEAGLSESNDHTKEADGFRRKVEGMSTTASTAQTGKLAQSLTSTGSPNNPNVAPIKTSEKCDRCTDCHTSINTVNAPRHPPVPDRPSSHTKEGQDGCQSLVSSDELNNRRSSPGLARPLSQTISKPVDSSMEQISSALQFWWKDGKQGQGQTSVSASVKQDVYENRKCVRKNDCSENGYCSDVTRDKPKRRKRTVSCMDLSQAKGDKSPSVENWKMREQNETGFRRRGAFKEHHQLIQDGCDLIPKQWAMKEQYDRNEHLNGFKRLHQTNVPYPKVPNNISGQAVDVNALPVHQKMYRGSQHRIKSDLFNVGTMSSYPQAPQINLSKYYGQPTRTAYNPIFNRHPNVNKTKANHFVVASCQIYNDFKATSSIYSKKTEITSGLAPSIGRPEENKYSLSETARFQMEAVKFSKLNMSSACPGVKQILDIPRDERFPKPLPRTSMHPNITTHSEEQAANEHTKAFIQSSKEVGSSVGMKIPVLEPDSYQEPHGHVIPLLTTMRNNILKDGGNVASYSGSKSPFLHWRPEDVKSKRSRQHLSLDTNQLSNPADVNKRSRMPRYQSSEDSSSEGDVEMSFKSIATLEQCLEQYLPSSPHHPENTQVSCQNYMSELNNVDSRECSMICNGKFRAFAFSEPENFKLNGFCQDLARPKVRFTGRYQHELGSSGAEWRMTNGSQITRPIQTEVASANCSQLLTAAEGGRHRTPDQVDPLTARYLDAIPKENMEDRIMAYQRQETASKYYTEVRTVPKVQGNPRKPISNEAICTKMKDNNAVDLCVSEECIPHQSDVIFVKCANCEKLAVFICSGCRSLGYCSRQCQMSFLPTHRRLCERKRQQLIKMEESRRSIPV